MNITERVSPSHPDKIADRIAGALVDYCYKQSETPKCAFEVLIGHGHCYITGETSVHVPDDFVLETVERICVGQVPQTIKYIEVPQDTHLAANQDGVTRCGDNGVFAGFPMPKVHEVALQVCQDLYRNHPYDGKIVLNETTGELTICWSNTSNDTIRNLIPGATLINPIGEWTGGIEVDTGVTGRKLASDFYGIEYPLGGGTMHGKDLSKADCSVNIYCYLLAQETQQPVKAICSIGDKDVLISSQLSSQLVPFAQIIARAREYIDEIGGFEKFAEWGLR